MQKYYRRLAAVAALSLIATASAQAAVVNYRFSGDIVQYDAERSSDDSNRFFTGNPGVNAPGLMVLTS